MKRTMSTVGLVAALSVTGCVGGWGGGKESNPGSPTSAEGLWIGTTSNSRSFGWLVLDDGTYWALYSPQGSTAFIAGVLQGAGAARGSSFASSNGRDFNREGLGVNDFTVNASYVMKQSFNGIMKTASGGQATFTSSYDSDYDLTPSLAAIAGNYSGSAATSSGTQAANVSISAAGVISGSGASGCTFSGSAEPRAHGNVYNVSITFHGGACANGTSTVAGVAYYDASAKVIRSTTLNSDRTGGFIYVGTKP